MAVLLDVLKAIQLGFSQNTQLEWVSGPSDWTVPEGGIPDDAGLNVRGRRSPT